MWAQGDEEKFKQLLQRVAKKATKESLDAIATFGVEHDKKGYKNVCALLVRQLKALKPDYRIRVFYAISAIVRLSKEKRGSKDKYVGRLMPLLDEVGRLLAEAPTDHRKQALKVLNQWWHEEVFPAPEITRLRELLNGDGGTAVAGGQPMETASACGAAPLEGTAAAAVAVAGLPAAPAGTAESSGPIPGLHSPMSLAQESGAASADGSKSAVAGAGAGGGTGGDSAVGGGGAGAAGAAQASAASQLPAPKRPRVEWGARVRQASSSQQPTPTATAGSALQQPEVQPQREASTAALLSPLPPSSAASVPHTDSSQKLPQLPQQQQEQPLEAQPPLPPVVVSLGGVPAAEPQPLEQQHQQEEEPALPSPEYDPLAVGDEPGLSGGGIPTLTGAAASLPLPPGLPPPPPVLLHAPAAPLPPLPAVRAPFMHPQPPQQAEQQQVSQPAGAPVLPAPPPPLVGAAANGIQDVDMEDNVVVLAAAPLRDTQGAAAQQAQQERRRRSRWEEDTGGAPAGAAAAALSAPAADGAAAAVGALKGQGATAPAAPAGALPPPPPVVAGAEGLQGAGVGRRRSRWEG